MLEIATRDQERLQLQMRQVKFNYFNIHRDTVKVDFSPYICLYFARRHDSTGSR